METETKITKKTRKITKKKSSKSNVEEEQEEQTLDSDVSLENESDEGLLPTIKEADIKQAKVVDTDVDVDVDVDTDNQVEADSDAEDVDEKEEIESEEASEEDDEEASEVPAVEQPVWKTLYTYCERCKEYVYAFYQEKMITEATAFPVYMVWVHGRPLHGLLLRIDRNFTSRGERIVNIEFDMQSLQPPE